MTNDIDEKKLEPPPLPRKSSPIVSIETQNPDDVSLVLEQSSIELVDHRNSKRVEINHEFHSVEDFIHEYVQNISKGGIFIRSPDPLSIGTKVNLKFSVIVEDFETIEGTGVVVRTVLPSAKSAPGMGISFLTLTGASKKVLEGLLEKRNNPIKK